MTTKKSILLAVLVVVLLTFSVSGTIAWLTTSTKPIENTFTPATVDTVIDEDFDGTAKSSIIVFNKNTTTNVPVYVRVALVANWVKMNEDNKPEIVAPASVDLTGKLNTTDWVPGDDGYYYYTKVVPVGEATSNLLAANQTIELTKRDDGASLQVVVLHQSIQADGGAKDAINAWTN